MKNSLLVAFIALAAADVADSVSPRHYGYFNRDGDIVHEQSFLDTERFDGRIEGINLPETVIEGGLHRAVGQARLSTQQCW